MMSNTSIHDVYIVDLNKIHNRAGNITVIGKGFYLPFKVRRIYYLYDIPSGAGRGAHAHKELKHIMVAASGCFDIILNDGKNKKTVQLNRPNYGLYIPPGIWVEVTSFSSGAISLNLVSDKYDENDYLRNYKQFLKFKNENTSDI